VFFFVHYLQTNSGIAAVLHHDRVLEFNVSLAAVFV